MPHGIPHTLPDLPPRPKVEHIHAPATMEGSEGLLAVFVYSHKPDPGVTFFSPPELNLQVGSILHPRGYAVPPHVHLPAVRHLSTTQEVILVRSGLIRIKVYTYSREEVCERYLRSGDLVILVAGGHSLECLADTHLLEVKTGPYAGRDKDKEAW